MAQSVDNRRALDHHGWFLMAGQMSNRRLIDAAPGVDIHRIDDLVRRLGIFVKLMLILILPRGSQ